jgi:ATP-dependent helicase/nuclease subunit A
MTETVRLNQPQRKASDPRQSAWVNANAGAGKTHVLVDRVIRLILAGTPPARILCLTFTTAAAAEMSARIFNRLAGWIGLADEALATVLSNLGCEPVASDLVLRARQLFAAIQETPGGLKIQTIHAFCEKLLQMFPVEAGVAPGFSVLDAASSAEIRNACRDAVITEAVLSPESDLGRALTTVTAAVTQEDFDELVGELMSSAITWYEAGDPASGIDLVAEATARHLGLTAEEVFGGIGAAPHVDVARYRQLAGLMTEGTSTDKKIAIHLEQLFSSTSPSLRDAEGFLLTSEGEPRKTSRFPTKEIRDANPWIVPFIESEQNRLIAALAKLGDISRVNGTKSLLLIAAAILQRYDRAKRQRGQYDFGDLIDRTSALLAEKPDAAWVLYKLDGGIDHLLIDEAQDTSPAQWKIVRSLTGEFFAGAGIRPHLVRTVFAVGDRKQSIFSFQGADPRSFEEAREHFAAEASGADQPLADVSFRVSFRSVPEVLTIVDAVFGPSEAAERGLNDKPEFPIQHDSNRLQDHGLVELWPLIEPDEKQDPEPWMAPVDLPPANAPARKMARLVAGKIGSWIGTRRIGNSDRTVTPGDILILVRHRNAFFDAVISELRRVGVPVAGADRLELRDSIAVLDLLALASFAVMPEDDYSLACVLKSPLVSVPVTENELFELSHGRGDKSLWQMLRESTSPVHKAVALEIGKWLALSASLPPFEFFASVVQQRRLAILARLGTEANDPLNALLQAALDHGRDHVPSLPAFLNWFKASDIEIKRDMDQPRGEVRVMTVHGAKGLEAPIIILPDTTSLPEGRNPARDQIFDLPIGNGNHRIPVWAMPNNRDSEKFAEIKDLAKAASREEFHRLLYVAMTRARDELYVCGYHGKSKPKAGNWHELVKAGLLRSEGTRTLPDGSLRYGVDPHAAEHEPRLMAKEAALPHWLSQPVAAPDQQPVSSVTGLAGHSGGNGTIDQDAAHRGSLVHRLLQLLPEAPESDRQELAERVTRRAGQPQAVAAETLTLLSHPALVPLLSGDALTEVALSAPLPRFGISVSGRIDRLVVDGGRVTIADYKTDRTWPASLEGVPAAYARQMALYREVMKGAYPGKDIRCVLVWTAAPAVMELPSSFLDQALARHMAART